MVTFPQKILTFPKKLLFPLNWLTFHPKLFFINKICKFMHYLLIIACCIYILFMINPTECQKIKIWGGATQFEQCHNFDGA